MKTSPIFQILPSTYRVLVSLESGDKRYTDIVPYIPGNWPAHELARHIRTALDLQLIIKIEIKQFSRLHLYRLTSFGKLILEVLPNIKPEKYKK